MKLLRVHCIMFIFLSTMAQAQNGPKIDVTEFDVGGVKLGMTVEEVVSAIKEKYEVAESDIIISESSLPHPELGKGLVQTVELLSEGAVTTSLHGMRKGTRLRVFFVPRVPYSNKDVIADVINYELPFTSENSKSLRDSAVEKYGAATVNNSLGGLSWCGSVENWGGCNSDAFLTVLNTAIELRDDSLRRKDLEARQAAKKEKPKI